MKSKAFISSIFIYKHFQEKVYISYAISFWEKVLFTEKNKLQSNVLNLNLFCKNNVDPHLYLSMHFMGLYRHGEGINGSCQNVTLETSREAVLEGVWRESFVS